MAKIKEDLPPHFQRVENTGMLRVIWKVPKECRPNLPEPYTGRGYLIEHLGTSDLKEAQRRERLGNFLGIFERLVRDAKPVATKWAYVPPTAWEIERVRILLEALLAMPDPSTELKKTVTDSGIDLVALWRGLKDGTATPVVEGTWVQVPANEVKNLSFDAGVDLWADEKTVPGPSRDAYKSRFKMLQETTQHDNANLVTRADLIAWKDAMVQSGLASKTIRNYLGYVTTVFNYLHKNEKIDKNPNDPKITYTVQKNHRTSRQAFDDDDRAAIYRAALADIRPFYRYANLLMLFSGMRVGEVSEATTYDVREVEGIWFFVLDVEHRDPGRDLKTDGSIRKVPLHSAVLKAGFLEYVKGLPAGPLFPQLTPNSYGKLAPDASRKLGNWLRETAEISNRRKVNHSNRHTVITILCECGVRETTAKRIAGHKLNGDIHEDYVHRSPKALKRAVEKIPVPTLVSSMGSAGSC